MVFICCDNENCESMGSPMELENEDDRQEWYEGYYVCEECGQRKTHRVERDQIGLVTRDEIIDEEDKNGK